MNLASHINYSKEKSVAQTLIERINANPVVMISTTRPNRNNTVCSEDVLSNAIAYHGGSPVLSLQTIRQDEVIAFSNGSTIQSLRAENVARGDRF